MYFRKRDLLGGWWVKKLYDVLNDEWGLVIPSHCLEHQGRSNDKGATQSSNHGLFKTASSIFIRGIGLSSLGCRSRSRSALARGSSTTTGGSSSSNRSTIGYSFIFIVSTMTLSPKCVGTLTGKVIRLGSAIALKLEDARISPVILVRLTNTDPIVTRTKVIQGINL